VDDCGGAFTMGAIGGGIFQAVKGFRNAPSVSLVTWVNTYATISDGYDILIQIVLYTTQNLFYISKESKFYYVFLIFYLVWDH